jgi:membrane-associated phospholipid phosphatase
MTTPPEQDCQRVRRVLEHELEQIDSPEAAEAVVQRVEQLAAGQTEQVRAKEAAETPAPAAVQVERATTTDSGPGEVAAVLAETAAQAVAPTPEAPAVLEAAREVLRPAPAAPPSPAAPPAERGRSLLKEAVLRHMGPLQALDARLFLAVNCVPHPRWLDTAANVVTVVTTGGGIWIAGVLIAYLLRVPKSWRALVQLLPSVAGATWILEYPVKAYFRRRRPFIDIVRALVVGKKPGSWSFPSGHTASSFACAWVLSTVWPRRAPGFFALAACVGLSRIYVGAHYPGDVTSGALLGMSLAEVFRRLVRRAFNIRS